MTVLRRSSRLQKQYLSDGRGAGQPKRKKRVVKKKATSTVRKSKKNEEQRQATSLPRTRERQLGAKGFSVMGIDEAGRGPLAGPVVAAAAMVPSFVPGITDSKKLTQEDLREELYDQLVNSPNIRWAVAIVDAPTIDEINILQATLRAMRMAAESVSQPKQKQHQVVKQASATVKGCYVVCGQANKDGCPTKRLTALSAKKTPYALIDGNRLPQDMPCEAEAIIKGDSREYLIGAASILAKVTRDRLMREYDTLYPEYNLAQHKGYPTAAHMALVREHGASPIHRRSFAPLKHMEFDNTGKVVES